jgi:5-methylthioribose kinase
MTTTTQTPEEVRACEMDAMLDELGVSIKRMQAMMQEEIDVNIMPLEVFARINRTISDTLDRIYKIRYGKAAQEEIQRQIGDLQRNLLKVESVNAERERRSNRKPLVEIVGQLAAESEMRAQDLSDDLTGDQGLREKIPAVDAGVVSEAQERGKHE